MQRLQPRKRIEPKDVKPAGPFDPKHFRERKLTRTKSRLSVFELPHLEEMNRAFNAEDTNPFGVVLPKNPEDRKPVLHYLQDLLRQINGLELLFTYEHVQHSDVIAEQMRLTERDLAEQNEPYYMYVGFDRVLVVPPREEKSEWERKIDQTIRQTDPKILLKALGAKIPEYVPQDVARKYSFDFPAHRKELIKLLEAFTNATVDNIKPEYQEAFTNGPKTLQKIESIYNTIKTLYVEWGASPDNVEESLAPFKSAVESVARALKKTLRNSYFAVEGGRQ